MSSEITFHKTYLYIAWVTALLASAASIFFIEILGKPAAPLCWFERMLLFSLFLLLTVAIIRNDDRIRSFTVPFLMLGIPAAIYQQLIHWDIIHLPPQPCGTSIVCTTKFFNLFGFITQATLCLAAQMIIAWCMYSLRSKTPKTTP